MSQSERLSLIIALTTQRVERLVFGERVALAAGAVRLERAAQFDIVRAIGQHVVQRGHRDWNADAVVTQ